MASEDTSTLNDQIAAIYDKLALGDKSALQALQQVHLRTHIPKFVQNSVSHSEDTVKNNSRIELKSVRESELAQQDKAIKNTKPFLDQRMNKQETNKHVSSSEAEKAAQQKLNGIPKSYSLKAKDGLLIINEKAERINSNAVEQKHHGKRAERYNVKLPVIHKQPLRNQNIEKNNKLMKEDPTVNHFSKQNHISHDVKNKTIPKINRLTELPSLNPQEGNQKRKTTESKFKNEQLIVKEAHLNHKEELGGGQGKKSKQLGKKHAARTYQLRKELLSINEEERRLQADILTYHNQTKGLIETVKAKYKLNFNKKKDNDVSRPSTPIKQIEFTDKLYEQVKQIDIELANKHETIKQAAEFIERLDLNAYIKKCMCEPIQKDQQAEQQKLEEADSVQDLPMQAVNDNRYSKQMTKTKSRKWGLQKRMQYDARRSISDSRISTTQQQMKQSKAEKFTTKFQDGNRVIVNQKLSKLLLE